MKSIGIDIGGTSIKGALFSNGNIIKSTSCKTRGNEGREQILESLTTVINNIFDLDVQYIGISSAGNINPATGICVYASDNLKGWTGFNIQKYISDMFSVPVYLENDANAALIAEVSVLNEDEKNGNICMLTIGTGLGCAIMTHSKIYYGTNFDGGSYAHLCVNPAGMPCDCGKIGCGEKELSATGLYYYGKLVIPQLENVEQLFDLYRENNQNAIKVINEYSVKMNAYLKELILLKNLDIIIIGGGVSKSKDILQKIIHSDATIIYAKHGNDAGVIGANLLKNQNETKQHNK